MSCAHELEKHRPRTLVLKLLGILDSLGKFYKNAYAWVPP